MVAAVGSGKSLSVESVARSPWLRYQAGIAGLDLDRARLTVITEKDGKDTSGIVFEGDKALICSMGSNNIPNGAAEKMAEIFS